MPSEPTDPNLGIPHNVKLVEHSLAQHKLTLMRDRSRKTELDREKFRRLMREIGLIMCAEVTRELRLKPSEFNIDSEDRVKYEGMILHQHKIVVVPVIRGGLILAEAFFELLPMAQGGHIGIHREFSDRTVKVTNFFNAIPGAADTDIILLDCVIVTGTTMEMAIDILLKLNVRPERIFVVSLIAHRGGLNRLFGRGDKNFSKINVFTLDIDEEIDAEGNLVPGIGDVGMRLYGTKRG
jgi:uracil phosphoribosyltransferase